MFGHKNKIGQYFWVLITGFLLMKIGPTGCSNSDAKFAGKTKILGKKKSKDNSISPSNSSDAVEGTQSKSNAPTTKNFLSSKINHGSFSFDFATKEAQSSITMGRTPGSQVSFVQSDRPKVEKTFQQIVNVANKSEVFVPQDIGLVDILVVVDDSGSMKPFQQKIAPKLTPLMSAISDRNWRLGVTTTSFTTSNRKFATFNKGETDVNLSFQNYINSLGTNGDGDERGIEQTKWALDKSGFLRDGSSIAVLVVSDENNCKSGLCGQNQVQSLLDKFSTLGRKAGETAKVYSIIVPKIKSECSGLDPNADFGADYQALSDLTGGVVGKICDNDYTPILSRISSDIASLFMNQFSLQHLPTRITSLQMTVAETKTQLSNADYDLVGQNIIFKMRPPANSRFDVTYELRSSDLPLTKSFDLGEPPYDGSLKVYVNNTQWNSGFTVTGSWLEFTTLPPSGSSIKATWSQNAVLQKTFSLDVGNLAIDPESLQATVNGQLQAFTRNGLSVVFETAPDPLSTVIIKYDLAKLDYDFSPGVIVAGSLKAVDQYGQLLNPQFNGKSLKFAMNEFQNGKVVTLSHRPEWSALSRKIEIPHSPLDSSVILKGKVNGLCADIDVDPIQKTIFIKCEMPGETGVDITYVYITDVQSSFSAEDVIGCDNSSYEVFVNHVSTSNFKVNGCIVTINDRLPNESSVKILVAPL